MNKQKPKQTEAETRIVITAPGEENKKRYKVGLTYVGAHCWTVFADSPQEAANLVSQGQGREAGIEEEEQIAIQAYEMKEGEKPKAFVKIFLGMLHHMQQMTQQANRGGGITRPSGIIVPEFVPPDDVGG